MALVIGGCGSSGAELVEANILQRLDGTAWTVVTVDGLRVPRSTVNFFSVDETVSASIIDDCIARATSLTPREGGFEVNEGVGPVLDCEAPLAQMFRGGRSVDAEIDSSEQLVMRSEGMVIVAQHFQSVSVQQ